MAVHRLHILVEDIMDSLDLADSQDDDDFPRHVSVKRQRNYAKNFGGMKITS